MGTNFHTAYVLRAIISCLLATTLLAPLPARAMPSVQTFGGDPLNAFPVLFPDLLTLPAPAWIREGQRVSYYVQSATMAQGPDDAGAGGAGFLQHDIVAVTRSAVVVASTMYGAGESGVTPAGTFGAAFRPGVSDFWLNPAVLDGAEAVASEALAVVRMPYTVAETEYDAVRFEYHSDGAVTISMFDTATGLLIYFRHTVGADPTDTRSSSELYLLSRRLLRLPWRGTKAPAWLAEGDTLDFAGARSIFVAGAPAGQFAEQATVDVALAAPRWSALRVSSSTGGIANGAVDRVTGVAQLSGALWLPAEALRAVVRRPQLDRDPITGVVLSYARNADRSITLTEQGDLFRIDNTYDGRTGQLIGTRSEVQTGLAVQITELAAR